MGHWANSIAPDVTPQNAASHLGLLYLLEVIIIEKCNKNLTTHLMFTKNEKGL